MKTYLTYGGISAFASAIFSLIVFLLGYQTTKYGQGAWLGLFAFIIPLAILYLGMRDARETYPNKATEGYPYGKAVLAALMISLFSGIFYAVYAVIHVTFINPDWGQYAADFVRSTLESQGKPAQQIEAAAHLQKFIFSPVGQAIFSIIGALFIGTLEGVILAIFVKRPAPADQVKAV